MSKNFYRYVDLDGKMPVLSYKKLNIPSHQYYVRYSNNRPIAKRGPLTAVADDTTGTKIYCYDRQLFVDAATVADE